MACRLRRLLRLVRATAPCSEAPFDQTGGEARQTMSRRRQNERKFGAWEDLPGGGRRYWLDVEGRGGWSARYVKEVDADENTLRFHQEIRDERGTVVETHEKYPEDMGHRKVGERQ